MDSLPALYNARRDQHRSYGVSSSRCNFLDKPGSSWPIRVWILGRCNTISVTRTSSTRFDIANFLPSGFAISGRTSRCARVHPSPIRASHLTGDSPNGIYGMSGCCPATGPALPRELDRLGPRQSCITTAPEFRRTEHFGARAGSPSAAVPATDPSPDPWEAIPRNSIGEEQSSPV